MIESKIAALLFVVAIGLGFLGGNLSSSEALDNSALIKEQQKTNEVLQRVAENDSLVLIAQEEALFYKELNASIKLKFDSLRSGTSIKVELLDSLVQSDFESLDDSIKLQYRDKILARLGNR